MTLKLRFGSHGGRFSNNSAQIIASKLAYSGGKSSASKDWNFVSVKTKYTMGLKTICGQNHNELVKAVKARSSNLKTNQKLKNTSEKIFKVFPYSGHRLFKMYKTCPNNW